MRMKKMVSAALIASMCIQLCGAAYAEKSGGGGTRQDSRTVNNVISSNATSSDADEEWEDVLLDGVNADVATLSNAEKKAAKELPEFGDGIIWQKEEFYLDGTRDGVIDLSEYAESFRTLEEGTLHVRFRAVDANQSADAGLQTLFSISDSSKDGSYADFFVNPNSSTVGLEMKQDGNLIISSQENGGIHDENWHTVSYVFNGAGELTVYLDGKKCIEESNIPFLNAITDADTVRVGDLSRAGRGDHLWAFKGDMNCFTIYEEALSEEEISELHEATVEEEKQEIELPETAVKTEPIDLFYEGYEGANAYRIPSLLTTESGVVLAAIDKRNTHASDWDDIDTALRRSFDGGKTWEDLQILIDNPEGGDRWSFTIDTEMLEDKEEGKIYLLVDMFPESTALGAGQNGSPITEPGSGYKTIGGERLLRLTDENETEYVLKDGVVYQVGDTLTETEYTVPEYYTGELKKNDKPAGNIFLYTGENAGELSVFKTSYLWLISSEDDGETWSEPVSLNGQVKEDWMVFMGTGPGVGIQIEHGPHAGRLVFPVYYSNANGLNQSQSSAVIYSDDHGETWHRGESPNDGRDGIHTETMNDPSNILTEAQVVEVGSSGRLKLFCRNRSGKVMVATSDDGGETWDDVVVPEEDLYDSYCQMSIIQYPTLIEEKPAYIFSNPARSGRNDGTVRIGFYDEETDTFDWKYKQMVHEGRYQYSCLTVLENGDIGLLYEGDVPYMKYTSMSVDWLRAPRTAESEKPEIKAISYAQEEDGLRFTVDFTQCMIKTGKPVLKISINGKSAEASYVSGSGTNQYEFWYAWNGTVDELKVLGVKADTGGRGFFGNMRNEAPEDREFVLKKQEEADKPESGNSDYQDSDDDDGNYGYAADAEGSWSMQDGKWRFRRKDGSYPGNEWKQLYWNGHLEWYYFDAEGWMQTGWFDWNGKRYYLHAAADGMQGHMYTGWNQIGDVWYYFGTDGALFVNGTTPDGYRTDGNGVWIQ